MVASLNRTRPSFDQGPNYDPRVTSLTATTTITQVYDGRLLLLDNATGFTVTLPAAIGSGGIYKFLVKTTVTSGSMVIKVANTTDSFIGNMIVNQDAGATVTGFEIVANDDTITMNGSTTGGIVGDYIEIQDIASGLFYVRILSSGTGTEATLTSATV